MPNMINNIKTITITKIESAQLESVKEVTNILNHRGDTVRQLTTGSIIITGSTEDGDDFAIEYISDYPIKTKVSINGKEIVI